MAKQKQKKKHIWQIILIIGICCLLVAGMLCVRYYKKQQEFVFTEHLKEVALSVDETQVSLSELCYYIYVVESYVNEQALVYNPEDKMDYWNTHFSAGDDSAFVCDMAKESAYDTCICDCVYENMAKAEGYALTEQEIAKAKENATQVYESLTEEQRSRTGLTEYSISKVEERKLLVQRYLLDYVKTTDLSSYGDNLEAALSAGGAYYEEKIKNMHQISENTTLKDQFTLGKITINY